MDEVREGALFSLMLSDGREVSIYPLTFGRARLVVGPPNVGFYDDGS